MYIPTQIGEKCHGGIYVGNYSLSGYDYLLICTEKKYEGKLSYMETYSSTLATSLTNGDINTEFLVNIHDSPAAKYCRELNIDGIADWYLPSKEELNLIYLAKNKIFKLYGENESFIDGGYWSSSEYSSTYSWGQGFGSGDTGGLRFIANIDHVRLALFVQMCECGHGIQTPAEPALSSLLRHL
jgi:hypothetical protein